MASRTSRRCILRVTRARQTIAQTIGARLCLRCHRLSRLTRRKLERGVGDGASAYARVRVLGCAAAYCCVEPIGVDRADFRFVRM